MKLPIIKAGIYGGLFAGAATAIAGATLVPALIVTVGTCIMSWGTAYSAADTAKKKVTEKFITVKTNVAKDDELRGCYNVVIKRKPAQQIRNEMRQAALMASSLTTAAGTIAGVMWGLGVFTEDNVSDDFDSFRQTKTEIQYAAAPTQRKDAYLFKL